MKKIIVIGLILLILGWAIAGIFWQHARAAGYRDFIEGSSDKSEQPAQNLTATATPSITAEEPAEPRVLPPVGGNAGLVLGASVLVLIIIGGVIFSSKRKPKH
jgi:hypothetical protein